VNIDEQIDHTARVITLTLTGELSDKAMLGLAKRVADLPDATRAFSLLIDLRQANGRKITSAGVQALAQRPLVLAPESRRAVVVATALGYGMARMYELIRGTGGMRVFRDYDEARKWVETGD
jgi:hypothetical protein